MARQAESPQVIGEHGDGGFGVIRPHADVGEAEVFEARHGVRRDAHTGSERALADVQVLQRREHRGGEREVLAHHRVPEGR